jgi:hypothetical protein
MPEQVELVFEVPECIELSHDEYMVRFARGLREEAAFAAKQRRRAGGRHVWGATHLLNVSIADQPRSKEMRGRTKGHIACKCREDRIAAIKARQVFWTSTECAAKSGAKTSVAFSSRQGRGGSANM